MNGLGDFQTPPELASLVFGALQARGIAPARVLEPTCGSGAFLHAAAATFPSAEFIGIEYQHERYAAVLEALRAAQPRLTVRYANAYETDFAALPWRGGGPLLIAGNPPWVTAAALGRGVGPILQPPRSNPKGLRGLAARTGAANFDVAEFLILKLLAELRAQPLALAMLVKESVARNVLSAAQMLELGVATAEIVRIDARAWFGVAVDACCLLLSTGPQSAAKTPVPIRPDFAQPPAGWFTPPRLQPRGVGAIRFRQGIKHDAADVFELRCAEGVWRNGYGEAVDIEPAHIYPLLKAGALHNGESRETMGLIVPQLRLGAPTDGLALVAPRLWRYLCAHAERIGARKSSIYRNAPPFALFGIGPYSFAPWKVAVAGLYARPRFRVIGPHGGRPVLLGDTSYFVAFQTELDARAFEQLCTSPALAAALAERVVPGKRPITKALLDDIDWPGIATTLDFAPDRLRSLFSEPAAP